MNSRGVANGIIYSLENQPHEWKGNDIIRRGQVSVAIIFSASLFRNRDILVLSPHEIPLKLSDRRRVLAAIRNWQGNRISEALEEAVEAES